MTRPSQVGLILLVLVNGMLLGRWRSGAEVEAIAIAVAVGLVVLCAVAVHLANEAADHRTDRLTRRTPFSGGSGALRWSGLSPRVPLRLALATAVLVALLAVVVGAAGVLAPVAVALLLAGLGGGLAYSLRPLAVMRRGAGEPLNALLGALLLPLFGVGVAAGAIGWLDVAAFLPFFLVTLASVMATAWPDRAADAATGKRTLQVRLAPRDLRRIHAGVTLAFVPATLGVAALDALPGALAGLILLPLLVVGTWRYTRTTSPLANVAAMLALALCTTAALAWSLSRG